MMNLMYRENKKTAFHLYLLGIIILSFVAFLFYLQISGSKKLISASGNVIEMGTAVSLTVYEEKGLFSDSERREQLSKQSKQILESIGELDRKVLSWRSEDSDVYQFNHLESGKAMQISPNLAKVINESLALERETYHAVDITLRPIIDLWGIESYDNTSDYIPPTEEALEKNIRLTGSDHIFLHENDSEKVFIEKDLPGLSLDLGAVGKGYALDNAAQKIAASEIKGAILAVGGSIMVWGEKGEPWKVGIRDPEGAPNEFIGILSITCEDGTPAFISTSGGYEKYVEYNDQRLVHIIDGRTFYPTETDLYSVTVLTSSSGLASDGLSTAAYILGVDGSKSLLEKYNAEAVYVTKDKNIYLTDGIRDMFSLSGSDYSVSVLP